MRPKLGSPSAGKIWRGPVGSMAPSPGHGSLMLQTVWWAVPGLACCQPTRCGQAKLLGRQPLFNIYNGRCWRRQHALNPWRAIACPHRKLSCPGRPLGAPHRPYELCGTWFAAKSAHESRFANTLREGEGSCSYTNVNNTELTEWSVEGNRIKQ
jgi:hypothetical protein